MKKIFLLFSHKLTKEQEKDAINSLLVDEFVYLDENLQKLWSNIPPDLSNLSTFLEPFKLFLKNNANKEDIILIQGDFGAVYEMVNFTKKLNLIPVYATTKREVKEQETNGSIQKISIFKHIMYRKF